MSLYTSLRADLGLTDGVPRAREIDSTAHVGSWSLVVGGAILGCLAVLLLVHAACCQAARRAVHSSDAPELEEVGCLRHVDTVQAHSDVAFYTLAHRMSHLRDGTVTSKIHWHLHYEL
ncbi:hypothetical protein AB1Y20_016168 [Prymnesium parvum]|uniref:Uncharacterized protein n=1 Tax=Prymnesium parvum TaxID=97485 RepID=A0AB34IFC1_PRYPA